MSPNSTGAKLVPKLLVYLLLLPSIAYTQTLHRDPPPPTNDAQQAVDILNGKTALPDTPIPPPPRMPKNYHPKAITLDSTANKALAIANDYVETGSDPLPGKDGRVVYRYGGGPADLVCAPLHVCTVELEPGETLRNQPKLGDPRWEVGDLLTSTKDGPQTYVTIRPTRSTPME